MRKNDLMEYKYINFKLREQNFEIIYDVYSNIVKFPLASTRKVLFTLVDIGGLKYNNVTPKDISILYYYYKLLAKLTWEQFETI